MLLCFRHPSSRPSESLAGRGPFLLARTWKQYLAQHCANINIYLFVIIIKWCCSSLATTLIVVLIFRSLRHRAVRWRDHLAAGLAFRACIMMVCRLPSYDVCADLRRTPLILNRSIGEGLPTYKRKTITTVIQHGPGGLDLVLGYVGLVSYLGNLGMDLCSR